MSDLLSGLTDPGANAVGLGGYIHKDAVREALLAELDRLAADEHTAALDGGFSLGWNGALAEVRRAVAGGDDE